MKTNRAITEYSVPTMNFFNTSSVSEQDYTNIDTNGSVITNSSNGTINFEMPSEYRHPPEITAIYIIAYGIAFLFALFGNVIVIAVVLRYRWMHTVTNFFIVNLAIADILVALFCIPVSLLTHIFVEWRYGAVMCKITPYLQTVSVCASVNTLAAIAVDRYLAICYTFNYKMTWTTSKCIMCFVWVFSLGVSIPMVLYRELILQGGLLKVCIETYPSETVRKVYFIGIFVFFYAIPLILIIFCYSFIGFRVWNRNAPGIFKANGVIHKSKVKVVKMLAVVVIIFFISWLPNYIIQFWVYFEMDQFRDYDSLMFVIKYISPVAQWMVVSNSGINPVIYCLFSKKIRLRIKAMLKCHSKHFLDRTSSHPKYSSTRYFSVDYSNGHVTLRPYGIEKRRKSSMRSFNSNFYD
ncbi:neuropeptide SIFamide receptor-like [Mytilus californianus]|uniref:neuropeptide SIFamide receptor-like n=1 Tax=Mytilus californianus TaxID=6549 RepID=UPI0022476F82|nr:neuropeptide SIFamide receptor-like [Mytilus californianus]